MTVDPQVFEVVSGHLTVKKVVRDKIYCLCPRRDCPDEAGHMVVYASTRWTKCFRCGRSAPLRRILKMVGATTPGVGNPPRSFSAARAGRVKLPGATVPLWKKPRRKFAEKPYNYLTTTRNVDPELARRHEVQYCYDGRYKGRLIFPVRDRRGEVVYFLARLIDGEKGTKYKNPPFPSMGLFYGMDRVEPGGTVFLVEGAFDKIRVGDQALAAMGKKMELTREHMEFLLSLNPELVVIFFDADALIESYRVATELESVLNVAVLPLSEGDPDNQWNKISHNWEKLLVTSGFRKTYLMMKSMLPDPEEGAKRETES